MDCQTFERQIDAYQDDALDAPERAAMAAHLAACPRCRARVRQVRRWDELLRAELLHLAAASPEEQVKLRERVLGQLGLPAKGAGRRRRARWLPRLLGLGTALALALIIVLTLWPGGGQTVSAAEVVHRAWAAVKGHRGMDGVLRWEAEWSQRFPSGEQITHTFEILFDFDDPGRYRITQRDPDGRVYSEMVRDGEDHMWQLYRTRLADGREQMRVDEILLSPQEMAELSSWYVPSPFVDDLDRLAQVLDDVQLVAETEVGGRTAYVLRGQLFGFGWPRQGSRIDPVTSTVQLVVDAETWWLLGRVERVGDVTAGFVQRTRRFDLLPPEQVPPDAFEFAPPPGAEVRTVQGIAGYYAPSSDAIGLDEAAALTSFTLVLPAQLPADLNPRPHFRYQGPGRAGTFGILYLGRPGRQAFLLQHAQALPLGRAARLVAVGERQGWLVPDPIDGHKFSLYLVQPRPDVGPDGRPWPGGIELQVWGLSLEEAVAMLASLEPYQQ